MAARRPPLGQHFLRDPHLLAHIAHEVDAAARHADLVVEIGAGPGALTRRLVAPGRRLLAIELDRRLASRLQTQLPDVEVLPGDVLELDLKRLIEARTSRPAVLAGNLPYYITSPILERVFDAGDRISTALLLMQKEVAQRVAAAPGRRDYGFLSVMCQAHSRPEILCCVPPRAFRPAPKVDSAFVRFAIEPRSAGWGIRQGEAFLDFARLCFRHKRKTLANNLAETFGKEIVRRLPEANLRAEQLPPEALASLCLRLSADC